MALIGKIRKNLWFVIILLGLALVSFLIMDMTNSDTSALFGGNSTTVGTVAGKEIGINDFNAKMDLRYNSAGANQFAIRQDLWDNLVNEAIVDDQSAKMGLAVSADEVEKLSTGAAYSPYIRRLFSGQGQPFNQEALDNHLASLNSPNIDPKTVNIWNEHVARAKNEKLAAKLTSLVSSSIYAPTWLAKKQHNDQNDQAAFSFVRVNFDQVDKDVALADSDYQNYINKNKAVYVKDVPQQTISYVSFDVIPTSADSSAIKNELVELLPEMKSTNNLKRFIGANRGVYHKQYYTEDEVSDAIENKLFTGEIGTVFSPYIDGTNYRVAKLLDRKIIPDSVTARHILVQHNPQSPRASKDTIAVIQAQLAQGVSFDSLAAKYSADQSNNAKGGDLGTFARNLFLAKAAQPFNNYCFYEGKEGSVGVVETNYGIHLVEILKQNKSKKTVGVQVAYLERPIVPSKKTISERFSEASKFATENNTIDKMKKAAIDANMDFETSEPLDENGFSVSGLGSGDVVRRMVKWTNDHKVGEVNPLPYRFTDPVRFYENKYVVAGVASKDPAGLPSMAALKKSVGPLVMNEKKGEILAAELKGLSLADIATKYETSVDSTKTTFNGRGLSPELVAAVFQLKEAGQTTAPIVTPTGVYVAQLNATPVVSTPPTTMNPLKNSLAGRARQSARTILPALKKKMNVEDKRNDFF